MAKDTVSLSWFGLRRHFWLETRVYDRIFVADGTAGQIVPAFPEGYYDFAYLAPWSLSELYLNPSFSKVL